MNIYDLTKDCEQVELSQSDLIADFDCGDQDLNNFFNRDAVLYQQERLGKTFFHRDKRSQTSVCAFSLSADSVKTFLLTKFLFSTEEDERQNLKKSINSDEPLNTRQLFFDLKRYE